MTAIKWADYGISAVRYNSEHTRIDRVRVHTGSGKTIGPASENSRINVVSGIKNGTTLTTITKDAGGDWQQGQAIFIIKINGLDYIKTVDDEKAEDILENLPEF